MSETFPLKEYIKYCSRNIFKTQNVHTEHYGIDSLAHLAPKIWALIPTDLKQIESVEDFKIEIKKWDAKKCPCHICKTYIARFAFL